MPFPLNQDGPLSEVCNLRQAVQWVAHDLKPISLDIEAHYRNSLWLEDEEVVDHAVQQLRNEKHAKNLLVSALKNKNIVATGFEAEICGPNSGQLWKVFQLPSHDGVTPRFNVANQRTEIPGEFWNRLDNSPKGLIEWNEGKAIDCALYGTSQGYIEIELVTDDLFDLFPAEISKGNNRELPSYSTKKTDLVDHLRHMYSQLSPEEASKLTTASIMANIEDVEHLFHFNEPLSQSYRKLIARMLVSDAKSNI